MDPLYVLFAATGLIFWVILLVSSIAIVASIENDAPGWATTTVALTFGVLYFFSDFSVRYTWHFDWRLAVTYLIGYIVIGIVWSIFKWYLSLANRRERWDDAVSHYRKTYQIDKKTPVPKNDQQFVTFISGHYPEFIVQPYTNQRVYSSQKYASTPYVEPRPEPNKARIILWMAYWPWSVLWSLLDDVIKGTFRHLYRMLKGLYEGMANWMFADVE